MKQVFKTLAIAFVSCSLMMPMADAQNRNGRSVNRSTVSNMSRSNSHSRQNKSASSASRKADTSRQNISNSQPRNNNAKISNRNSANNQRKLQISDRHPQGNNKVYDRPINNSKTPQGNMGNDKRHQPTATTRQHDNERWHFGNGGARPASGHGAHHRHDIAPPMRPHRPKHIAWSRPVPPPTWRPIGRIPTIGSILGVAFGTSINLSLNYLFNNGYIVDGYGRDIIYLSNVNQMSYYWPDATLYYLDGGLTRSQFLYSTGYSDMGRYNNLYNTFVSNYGVPVNFHNSNGSFSATWFGHNNGYITLQYSPQYTNSGHLRFFTTLTFGN